MLKMNAGVWIGIIGGIIGLAVGVGAVVATGGSEGKYIALGMLLLFGGVLWYINHKNNKRKQEEKMALALMEETRISEKLAHLRELDRRAGGRPEES